MRVYFVPDRIPRTTTREEWYKAWREYRAMKRDVAQMRDVQLDMIKRCPLPLRVEMYDYIINPPLVLGPLMS